MTATDERRGEATDRTTELVKREAGGLLAYFQRRVPTYEDAADLVSETFVVIWRRVDALPHDDAEARMWMFGIARRVLATHRRGRLRRHDLADRLRAELATMPSSSGDTRRPEVADALTALSEKDRELILLVHQDGFTLAEIARLLGRRPATIRSRYQRARQRLRAELEA